MISMFDELNRTAEGEKEGGQSMMRVIKIIQARPSLSVCGSGYCFWKVKLIQVNLYVLMKWQGPGACIILCRS